jgi:hypothetical protein
MFVSRETSFLLLPPIKFIKRGKTGGEIEFTGNDDWQIAEKTSGKLIISK